MKPISHRTGIISAIVCALFVSGVVAGEPPQRKPNIIVIYADDLGFGDLGCYGAALLKTPHVDGLAASGIRFTDAYATSATCTPSRYSLMTGEYAFRQKGTGVLPGDADLIIAPGRATLPSMLKNAGYQTGIVGKWHLGLGAGGKIDWNGEIRPGPLEVGFDRSFIMAATGDRVPCVYIKDHRIEGLAPEDPIQVSYKEAFPNEPTGIKNRADLKMDWSAGHNNAVHDGIGRIGFMRGGKAALWKDEDMADEFTKHALEFIVDAGKKPFFLYFATHGIHVPRVPNHRFAGKSGMGPRGDAILEFDDCVGKIMAKLAELDLAKDTLVILTSDNGPVLDDGYRDEANEKLGGHKPAGPLRGGKYSLFEGGTRVPFIVSWPGRVSPGTSGALVSQVDFCATLAALVGGTCDASSMRDSENVLPALLGDSPSGRSHIVEHAGRLALRVGDLKFITPGKTTEMLGPWRSAVIEPPGALFDVRADPGEKVDLASSRPEVVKAMAEKLEAVRKGE